MPTTMKTKEKPGKNIAIAHLPVESALMRSYTPKQRNTAAAANKKYAISL